MKASALRLIKETGTAAAGAAVAAGALCFAALIHDVTGPQRFEARTVSNLALASLLLPGVASLPLQAAGKASDKLARLEHGC